MKWNGENYETYYSIKTTRGLSDRDAIIYIEKLMEAGIVYAYSVGCMDILQQYTETKLPNSLGNRLYGERMPLDDNEYSGFMFFHKKLESWQLEKNANNQDVDESGKPRIVIQYAWYAALGTAQEQIDSLRNSGITSDAIIAKVIVKKGDKRGFSENAVAKLLYPTDANDDRELRDKVQRQIAYAEDNFEIIFR